MKTILLAAYTKHNVGDDLFIRTIINRYPNVDIFFYANDYDDILSQREKVHIVKNKLLFYCLKIWSLIGKNKYHVIIGGSIFQELNPIKFIINKPKILYKNCIFLGCNFGPYKTKRYLNHIKFIVKNSIDTCFRDRYSFNIFKEYNNVRLAPDILFSLRKIERKNREKKYVGISVINLDNRDDLIKFKDIYYDKIVDLAEEYVKNNEKILFFSFCKFEGDESAIENIISRINPKYLSNIFTCYYRNDNLDDVLKKISECKSFIACRLHSFILALDYQLPVFPIVYSQKVKNIMNDINYNGKFLNIENIDELNINEVKKYLDNASNTNICELEKKSEDHFSVLDRLLNE